MISLIQHTCPKNVAESLDNVLEVLQSTDFNIPVKADDLDNQMTTELLEGLMTVSQAWTISGELGQVFWV